MKNKKLPKYTIEQKIKDLHKAIVTKDFITIKKLQSEIDYFNYGIK